MRRGVLNSHRDIRGVLTSLEFSKLPYEVKRVFWITEVPENEIRGNHAHRHNWQTLICTKGSIQVNAQSAKQALQMTMVEGEYLVVPPITWVSLMFDSPAAVLLVACSHVYNPSDYITNYDEFIKHTQS